MKEWHQIPEHPGYEINKQGDVRSLRLRLGRTIKRRINGRGYYYVRLSDNGKLSYLTIHRLLAKIFIPNSNDYSDVNHIDGNKLNNDLTNLEWCSRSHNVQHAFSMGLNPQRRITQEEINRIRDLRADGWKLVELAREFKCSRITISRLISNTNKRRTRARVSPVQIELDTNWVQLPDFPNYSINGHRQIRNNLTGVILVQVTTRSTGWVKIKGRDGVFRNVSVTTL